MIVTIGSNYECVELHGAALGAPIHVRAVGNGTTLCGYQTRCALIVTKLNQGTFDSADPDTLLCKRCTRAAQAKVGALIVHEPSETAGLLARAVW